MADFDLDYLTSVQAALRRAQHQDDPYALPNPYNLPLSPPSTLQGPCPFPYPYPITPTRRPSAVPSTRTSAAARTRTSAPVRAAG